MSVNDVVRSHLETAVLVPEASPVELRASRLLSELERLDLPIDVSRRAAALAAAHYHFAALPITGMPLPERAGVLLEDLRLVSYLGS